MESYSKDCTRTKKPVEEVMSLFSAYPSSISDNIFLFILQVEQLHKIFKLCGSPPDDYWKKSKLPRSTLFKPQQPYDSCLKETFKDLPSTTVNLLETLLSIEPYKRGTASSALASEVIMRNIFYLFYLIIVLCITNQRGFTKDTYCKLVERDL